MYLAQGILTSEQLSCDLGGADWLGHALFGSTYAWSWVW